ncbi:PBECR4 domain-containing protein [Lactiplantibacillus dongliensis]|uniref:PBECR4 domain-containing protein n=1 Tax=Lactiplantibacillus dongliensis TaxID=2559919 RepID=A0ABW1R773_9LACO
MNELPKIYQAQQFIFKNLIGKSRYFFYKNGSSIKWLDVRFTKNNFTHLCGVTYQGGASRFWDKAINNKLSMDFIKVKNDGSTFQKLKIITAIQELNEAKLELTSNGSFLRLTYDHLLKTRVLHLTKRTNTLSHSPCLIFKISRENLTP